MWRRVHQQARSYVSQEIVASFFRVKLWLASPRRKYINGTKTPRPQFQIHCRQNRSFQLLKGSGLKDDFIYRIIFWFRLKQIEVQGESHPGRYFYVDVFTTRLRNIIHVTSQEDRCQEPRLNEAFACSSSAPNRWRWQSTCEMGPHCLLYTISF